MKTKIKIMNQQPELTDDEISDFMDFEELLSRRKKILLQARFSSLKWIIPALLLIGTSVWFISKPEPTAKESVSQNVVPSQPEKTTAVEPQANEQKVEEHRPSQERKMSTTPKGKTHEEVKTNNFPSQETAAQSPPVYIQAEPVDGYPALYQYLNEALIYPTEALKDSIHGVMAVSFTITSQGLPVEIQTTNSLGKPFDVEAKRLIENMPAWKPARLNGKPVPSKMSLPLTFQIQKIQSEK